MSGLSGPNDEIVGQTGNIEKVAGTTGLVGYASTYISLQAVNGIFINGIGSGNTPKRGLPFSDTPDENQYISGLTNGDFWISGQSGGAVIKSCNRSTSGQNGEGTGSIHINSKSGDVVVNVPNGNFMTHCQKKAIWDGSSESHTLGNEFKINFGAVEDIIFGDEAKINGGLTEEIKLAGELAITAGAALDIKLGVAGEIKLGWFYSTQPFGKSIDSDFEKSYVGVHLKDVGSKIETAGTHIKTAAISIYNHAMTIFH